jgi:hypothetical protein
VAAQVAGLFEHILPHGALNHIGHVRDVLGQIDVPPRMAGRVRAVEDPRWPPKLPHLWPPQTPPPEVIGDGV